MHSELLARNGIYADLVRMQELQRERVGGGSWERMMDDVG